jgi:CheY-like chemotaxis protein
VKVLALNSVVTHLEKMLHRVVGEDIVISTTLASDLGATEADGSQLEQVIVNLVVNARDAMPKGGKLVVETENVDLDALQAARIGITPGAYVALAVSDTGCGMDAATRSHIFEPFFTTKGVGKGTGLGLATVFGIIQQSNGGIDVLSEVGCGSTFRVYLPRVDALATPAAPPKPARAPSSHSGDTVLVVEDDPMLRTVIRRHLRALGYKSLEAADGGAALDLLYATKEHVGVLLTDLVMPGFDGRALAEDVLRLRPDMRVVFMSGYTDHIALSKSPTEHFLEKPFTSATLASTIRSALAPRG